MSAPVANPRRVAQAIDALRRGWSVALATNAGPLALLPIETADAARLALFDAAQTAPVLLSAGRAATLMLANQRAAAAPDCPVLVERTPWLDFDAATALADPQFDLQTPLKGPYRAIDIDDPNGARWALKLATLAGLLPAFFVIRGGSADLMIGPTDIEAHKDA